MSNPHFTRVHIAAHSVGLLGLVWALQNPSWLLVFSFLFFNFWLSGLGVSIGFHRYFTHRSFKTNKFWHYVMLIGGSLAGQGSAIFWVALHRMHHMNSDNDRDIHSPVYKGFWHAYMDWIRTLQPERVRLQYAADLTRDRAARFIHRHYTKLLWSYWIALVFIAHYFVWARPIVAGAFVAGMWAIHQEALINSVCHSARFGIRPFDTKDYSRDVHGLKYVTWGQSLHNTHHAFPASANFGTIRNPDIGFKVIRCIKN